MRQLEEGGEPGTGNAEDEPQRPDLEQDQGRLEADNPNHQYGYGGFREDVLYKDEPAADRAAEQDD